MAAKKWIPIVVGIVIFVMIVGVGLVASLIYVITRQVHVQTIEAANGQVEFDRTLASLAGQKPFIELPEPGSDREAIVHREMETKEPGSLSTLHMRIWLPDERKLVRLDLPFWMMRMGGNKPLKLHADTRSFEEVSLTVTPEEIERRGPGLVLDHTSRHGERILVWTE